MPVKNLTDRAVMGSGLPRLGRIFKGAKRTEEDIRRNRSGREQESFRIEFDYPYDQFAELWAEFYGGAELKVIPNVYLMGETPDSALEAFYEDWGAQKLLKRRCDGETQVKWFNAELGKADYTPIACIKPDCNCQLTARLNIIVPDFLRYAGALGFFTVNTGSFRDVGRMHKYLSDIHAIYGNLRSIPFFLGRQKEAVEIPEIKDGKATGKRFKSDKHFLSLYVAPEYVRATGLMDRPQLPANVDPETGEKMLPAGYVEADDDYDGESGNDPNWGHEMSLDEKLDEHFGQPDAVVTKITGDKKKEHWAKDASNRTRVVNLLVDLGFDNPDKQARALNKVDRRISDQPTEMRLGQSQFETVEEILQALKDEFMQAGLYDWDASKVDEYILSAFNREPVDFLRAMQIDDWRQFPDYNGTVAALSQFAMDNQWEVVSDMAWYHKEGNKTWIEFDSVVGDLRLYGGRDALGKMVGQKFMDENNADAWTTETDPIDLVPSLWLGFEQRDGYIAVTSASLLPMKDIDF